MNFLLTFLLVIFVSACGSNPSAPPISSPITSLDSQAQPEVSRAISVPLPGFVSQRIQLAEIDLASFTLPIQVSNYTLIWDAKVNDAPTRTLAQSMPGAAVAFAANESAKDQSQPMTRVVISSLTG